MAAHEEMFVSDQDTTECVFSGNIFKKSDYMGWNNRRYVRLLSKESEHKLHLAYWINERAYKLQPYAPRGILDLSSCKISVLANNSGGRGVMPIQVSCVRDAKGISWRDRSNLIYYLSFLTRVEGEAFCSCIAKDKKRKRSYNEVATTYDILGEIGKGGFSCVYRARPKDGTELVALKVISLARFKGVERKNQFKYLSSEIAIMKKLAELPERNPNIVYLHDSFIEKRRPRVCIVMDYCDGGELFDRIVQRKVFSEHDAAQVLSKIAGAICFLHDHKIVHRDLKPENLVYQSPSDDAEIKLADFGLALDMTREDVFAQAVIGTAGYYAPEVLDRRYGPSNDVWGVGVLLYILLAGYPPFYGNSAFEMRKKIVSGDYEFKNPEFGGVSDAAKDLIKRMLMPSVKKRYTIRQVLNHPFVCDDESRSKASVDSADVIQRLKTFNARRKFKAAALAVLWGSKSRPEDIADNDETPAELPEFDKEALKLIKSTFTEHAKNKENKRDGSMDGRVVTDVETFTNIMNTLGYRSLPYERLFQLFDLNRDGELDFDELISGLALLHGTGEDSLRLCFDVIDNDGNGQIDEQELKSILKMVSIFTPGDKMLAENLGLVFDKIDVNNDGKITFEEFKQAARSNQHVVRCFFSKVRRDARNVALRA